MPITTTLENPDRIDGHETFVEDANQLVSDLVDWTVEANALEVNVNDKEASAVAAAADSQASAGESAASAVLSAASANFKGAWTNLTGAAVIPYSCFNKNNTWALVNNLADVTISEPGVTADWVLIPGAAVNPNLFINPDGAINQYGYSGTVLAAAGDPGEDMWCAGVAGSQWTVVNGVTTMTAGKKYYLSDEMIKFNGQTVIMSIQSGSVSISGAGITGTEVVTPNTPIAWELDTSTGINVGLAGEVFGPVKLEEGEVVTKYIKPQTTKEELKCFRYLCPLAETYGISSYAKIADGYSNLGNSARVWATLPVAMRPCTPSLILPPDSDYFMNGGGSEFQVVWADLPTTGTLFNNQIKISITKTGLVASQTYIFRIFDTSSRKVLVDARYTP